MTRNNLLLAALAHFITLVMSQFILQEVPEEAPAGFGIANILAVAVSAYIYQLQHGDAGASLTEPALSPHVFPQPAAGIRLVSGPPNRPYCPRYQQAQQAGPLRRPDLSPLSRPARSRGRPVVRNHQPP